METQARPRRSMLFVPGANLRALDKARGLAADGLIFDLEDSVAPESKASARDNTRAALAKGGYGRRELLIRVNALATEWGRADLDMAAKSGAQGVVLPKVEEAGAVREAASLLARAGAPDALALWCMIETPRGVLRAEEIAAASPRLGGFIVGAADLSKDLHARIAPGRAALLPALAHVLLAARAAGIACLDSPYFDVEDLAGFEAECGQAAEMGFDGKTLIHPSTIAPANRIFAPSTAELAAAERIIAAHADARAKGSGVAVVEGKLVEGLHVSRARRLLDLAQQIALLVEESGLAP